MSFILSLLAFAFMPAAEVSAAMADTQDSYQTAFVYFLPDYQPKHVYQPGGCYKLGYRLNRSTCAKPRILRDKCPVGNYYKECFCAGDPTCNTSWSLSSANPFPSSTGASMSSCKDCPGKMHYNWTCSSSVCASYQLSSCPSHGYCSQCCDGYYTLNSCQSGYHISGSGSSEYCEKDCVPASDETGCSYGTSTCSDGCGGTRTCCQSCSPKSDETGCSNGTYSCSDGCGGTRQCCSPTPPPCTDTCTSMGYSSSQPAGKTCSTTTVCGSTCYYSCEDNCTDTCSSKGYYSSQPSGQTCSTTTVCGSTCYYSCQDIKPDCTPNAPATDCTYGTVSCSDGCDGTTTCCASCTPKQAATGCSHGTEDCDDGCGGKTTCCKGDPCAGTSCPIAKTCSSGCTKYSEKTDCCESVCIECCTPKASESSCSYGTEDCDDGCGGKRKCCKACSLPNCTDAVTTKPDNSHYTEENCTDCSGSKTIKTGWACDSGYKPSGNSCVKDDPCAGETCPKDVNMKHCSKYSEKTSCCESVCIEGYECQGSWECPKANPVCTDGFCGCKAGYSYYGDMCCDQNPEDNNKTCPNPAAWDCKLADCYY